MLSALPILVFTDVSFNVLCQLCFFVCGGDESHLEDCTASTIQSKSAT